jgi:predicted NodU family carbamoyl transferase
MLNDQKLKEEKHNDQDKQHNKKEPGDNEATKMITNSDKEENYVKDEITAVKEDITASVTTTEETTVVKKEKYSSSNVVSRELVMTGGHVCRLCALHLKVFNFHLYC